MYCWLGKNMLSFIRYHTVLHGGLTIYISGSNELNFLLLRILTSILCFQYHGFWLVPSVYAMVSHCFICISNNIWCRANFLFLFANLYIFLSGVSVQIFDPFFKQVTYFLIVVLWVLYVFSITVLFQPFWKNFLPVYGLFLDIAWYFIVLNFDTI